MHIENPLRLIRELKGAPLSIIMALTLVKQRVRQEWLERATGYTDKPVSQALAYLEEIGLVDHTGAGWQLVGNYQQLPLPLPMIEETQSEEPPAEELSTPPVDNSQDEQELSRNISDSESITYLLNTDINQESNKQVSNNAKSRKNSDPEVWKALTDAKIVGKKRQELAKTVSAEAVIAWELQLKVEKGGDYSPGLLIYFLESGLPAPELNANGHLASCDCDDCMRNKYRVACPDCGEWPCVCEYEDE